MTLLGRHRPGTGCGPYNLSMRTRLDTIIRSSLLCATLTLVGLPTGTDSLRADELVPAEPKTTRASCKNSCRGLGIEKVKAGEEHCGLVTRERKNESLAAACDLAESHREDLQRQAQEAAASECEAQLDSPACGCRREMRRWENVYTHVFSQRCWTECGWAFLIDCQRRRKTDDG